MILPLVFFQASCRGRNFNQEKIGQLQTNLGIPPSTKPQEPSDPEIASAHVLIKQSSVVSENRLLFSIVLKQPFGSVQSPGFWLAQDGHLRSEGGELLGSWSCQLRPSPETSCLHFELKLFESSHYPITFPVLQFRRLTKSRLSFQEGPTFGGAPAAPLLMGYRWILEAEGFDQASWFLVFNEEDLESPQPRILIHDSSQPRGVWISLPVALSKLKFLDHQTFFLKSTEHPYVGSLRLFSWVGTGLSESFTFKIEDLHE